MHFYVFLAKSAEERSRKWKPSFVNLSYNYILKLLMGIDKEIITIVAPYMCKIYILMAANR
jgi:hypothetical protein